MLDNDSPIPHSEYRECWCPGEARNQGINNQDTDFVQQ